MSTKTADQEIAPYNAAIVHRPEAVVAAATPADVADAVRRAARRGQRLAVQATGHGATYPVTSGVLLSTRALDEIRIDPRAATATVGAGARWQEVIAAAAVHGLMPVGGAAPSVGVAGLLLGGGLGPLARSHGFSSDYLEAATVVTAAGQVITAAADSHPELFWALRGGKHGLGIVTQVRIRLAAQRTLYAGSLTFATEHVEPVLRAWTDWTAQAHPQVTTSVAIVRYPPAPALPPQLRGRRLLHLRFAYPGAAADGERLAAPLRAAALAEVDDLRERPAGDVAAIHADRAQPVPFWSWGMMLSGIGPPVATAAANTPFQIVEVRHLGEATIRDVPGGSAVGGRPGRLVLSGIGLDPAGFARLLPQAADDLAARLRPWAAAETNINFLGVPPGHPRYATGWAAATRNRLAAVRAHYDPRGLLLDPGPSAE